VANFKKFTSLIKKYKFKKIVAVAEGGKKRQDSSFNGLKMAEKLGAKPGDLILFHNGCNPLVSWEEINKSVEAAKKFGAALICQKARDTVKEVKEGFVSRTVNREKIYLAQTPQTIEYTLAKRAFEKAYKEKFYGTDDVSLVERMGKKVKSIEGSPKNIKVTYPEDLELIRAQLK